MPTILIIDNSDYRTNVADHLRLENYITLEAENGLVGMQMIRHYLPDLILCEVDMPLMDGIEVLRATKTESKLVVIPFLIFSGDGNQRTVNIAQALGVDAYLIKPVSTNELLSVIMRFLIPPL